MLSTTIEEQFIAGYNLLSEEEKTAFTQSDAGQAFNQALTKKENATKPLLSYFYWSNSKASEVSEEEKSTLLKEIEHTPEYNLILQQITYHRLAQELTEFSALTAEQKKQVCSGPYSQELTEKLILLDQKIETVRPSLKSWGWGWPSSSAETSIKQWEAEKEQLIKQYHQDILNAEELQPLYRIKEENFRARALRLAQFFPLLNYKKNSDEKSTFEQIINKNYADGKLVLNANTNDATLLTELLYYCLEQMSYLYGLDTKNLQAFNKEQANKLTATILHAFNTSLLLKEQWTTWLHTYQQELWNHIAIELCFISGKAWQMQRNKESQEFKESLSFLLLHNKVTNQISTFFNKMADAHAFIQATGFSTQNENSFLAILDMYNYVRHHEKISETRSILTSLLSPFSSLYNEYRDIGLYEKNEFKKVLRSLIPILITTLVVVAIFAAIAPMALPEIALLVAFIPTLIVGLVAANLYAKVKNNAFHFLRKLYYGGDFEIPEFRVSNRMIAIFGAEKASEIREFYIEEFKKCAKYEEKYHIKESLTLEEQQHDVQNIQRKHQLHLEWYDIHSNKKLNSGDAIQLVRTRLQQKCDEKFVKLQEKISSERSKIQESIGYVTQEMEEIILPTPAATPQPEASLPSLLDKTTYKFQFFVPQKIVAHKKEIERLDALNQSLAAPNLGQ